MLHPTLPNLFLALAILLSTRLTILVLTPPNATSNGHSKTASASPTKPKDTIAPLTHPSFLNLTHALLALLSLHHVLLLLYYPSPPSSLCPHPSNLNPNLFTWSLTTSISLLSILLAAPVRLLAFKDLGKDFTFRVREPGRLVTSGLYAYVQHPSYTANIIIMLGNFGLLGRIDGGIGCWVPEEGVRSGWWKVVAGALVGGAVGLTGVRVRDEEAVLRGRFGKEWEVWHRRTWRFVPGVF
ncbi:hypothetical protein V8E51_019526 [Hyaloscypha variabilis]